MGGSGGKCCEVSKHGSNNDRLDVDEYREEGEEEPLEDEPCTEAEDEDDRMKAMGSQANLEAGQGSEDEMDDAEYQKQLAVARTRRASAVVAESSVPDSGWTPPVYPKSAEQRQQITQTVKKAFMFADLELKDLETVIDAFQEHRVPAGEEVIRQGAQVVADEPGLYVIEAGQLEVFKATDSSGGRGNCVFTYDSQGQSFGELALLYNAPRAATVVAKTESILWSIDRNTFNSCVKGAARRRKERCEGFLERVEILKQLTASERSKLVDSINGLTVDTGHRIIRKGDVGSELFILEEGSAEARSEQGETLKKYGPAEYFGELALLRQEPRAVDVVATTPTKLFFISKDVFDALLGPLSELLEERAAAYGASPAAGGRHVGFAPMPSEQQHEAGAHLRATPAPQHHSDEEEEHSDDELDDEAFEQHISKRRGSGVVRGAVLAEKSTPEHGWKPPVIEKTAEQRRKLEHALMRSFMFAALGPKDLAVVIDAFKEHRVKRGQGVIRQGSQVHADEPGLYVLESGYLDVFRDGEKVSHYDQEGQSFGELALLYNAPRAATIVAGDNSVLWSIDRNTFNSCVKGAAMKQQQRWETFLASVDMLKSLSREERSRVAEVLHCRIMQRGELIVRAGDPGEELFIVEEGGAEARGADGATLKKYGPTDYFGELALLHNAPRACDVVITQDHTVLLSLDRGVFHTLLGPLEDILEQRAKGYGSPKAKAGGGGLTIDVFGSDDAAGAGSDSLPRHGVASPTARGPTLLPRHAKLDEQRTPPQTPPRATVVRRANNLHLSTQPSWARRRAEGDEAASVNGAFSPKAVPPAAAAPPSPSVAAKWPA